MCAVVLASASPRRSELLQQMGVSFTVQPADVNETPNSGERPDTYVERLAREKALAVFSDYPDALVLGSDTSVVLDDRILGKPHDQSEARTMLKRLSGRSHQVMTSVALVSKSGCRSLVVVTDVEFRTLSEGEIDAYIASGEPMDKAGGYGIQGLGGIFVRELRGSYSAVVGLPLQETAGLLEQAGYPVWKRWPISLEN
ncbi:Maf family protein [Marinobacter sp. chi1]|uniref:dTTP/UTP pyrophosphatase n=1 Tax=Marinobacter suaedae TaxID=3057675 RepID=A0ABT8VWS0_9GAMM|nr:Maf family protein [Marinobacter sp. chi1]MDO3720383.1 Maf family protein [Marinobacter sp. chi1]